MDTYRTVLYLHVLSLLLGICAAAVVGVCLFRLRAAQTLADALPWGMLAGKTERVFPVAILGLFSTGAYMTSDVWTWSTGWIVVSIVGLALVALQGPLVAGLRAKALERALGENGPGPLGNSARRLARDPILWVVTFANPGIVLGILWNMINKPSSAEAITAVVVGYLVGAAVALPFTREQAGETQAVTDPTG
jgi:Predicted integral membrane protein (DUF2269)